MATNKRKDFTQVALDVVRRATGETIAPAPNVKQESGRKGGLKGGAARAASLTPEERSRIAKQAAERRWSKQPIAPAEVDSPPSRKKAKVAV